MCWAPVTRIRCADPLRLRMARAHWLLLLQEADDDSSQTIAKLCEELKSIRITAAKQVSP